MKDNTIRATFLRQELLAALLFCSDDDARYVLTGLCVKMAPGKKPTLAATDGRRLVLIESSAEQPSDSGVSEPCEVILRADFVKPICALNKATGGKLLPWVELEWSPSVDKMTATMASEKVVVTVHEEATIKGDYPNLAAVIPSPNQVRRPVSDLGINAKYIGDFAKAAELLESGSPAIQMRLVVSEKDDEDADVSAIEVKMPGFDNFYGLLMPCKRQEQTNCQPEFVNIVRQLPKPEPEDAEKEGVEA